MRKIPIERRIHWHNGGSLKSRSIITDFTQTFQWKLDCFLNNTSVEMTVLDSQLWLWYDIRRLEL